MGHRCHPCYSALNRMALYEGRPYTMGDFMPASKVALVTGSGAKRIGWYVADALAGRGFALAIHYNRSADEAADTVAGFRGRGVEVEAFRADLREERATKNMVDSVLQRFGRLDVL